MKYEDIYNRADELEAIAEKHGLLLSTELINFADDVWDLATKTERQTNAMAKEVEWVAPRSLEIANDALARRTNP